MIYCVSQAVLLSECIACPKFIHKTEIYKMSTHMHIILYTQLAIRDLGIQKLLF